MVAPDDARRELLLRLHGMDRRQRLAEQQQVVARHQLVADAHQLAEHLARRLAHAHVVSEALRHLLHAVQPLQQREQEDDLLLLALLPLEIAPDEDVEELVGPAQLDIRADHHRVPALHDGILELVKAHRFPLLVARLEILALHHLLQRHAAVELHHLVEAHHLEPFAVEDGPRPLRIEDFVSLLLEALRIRHHLIVRELRARLRAARRVADHRREIADDEDRLMPEVLELPQLREPDGEPEMDVRRRGIDAQLHVERLAAAQLGEEFRLGNDLRGAAFEEFELRFGRHRVVGNAGCWTSEPRQICKLRCTKWHRRPACGASGSAGLAGGTPVPHSAYLFLFSSSRTSSIVIGLRSPLHSIRLLGSTAWSSFLLSGPRYWRWPSQSGRVAAVLPDSRASFVGAVFTSAARVSYRPFVFASLVVNFMSPSHAFFVEYSFVRNNPAKNPRVE